MEPLQANSLKEEIRCAKKELEEVQADLGRAKASPGLAENLPSITDATGSIETACPRLYEQALKHKTNQQLRVEQVQTT